MTLRETQTLFWRAISWPTGVRSFLAQTDESTRQAFARTFVSSPEFGSEERMDVYADAYFWRLHEVLEGMFPVLSWLVGPAAFRNVVTDHVLALPSRNPNLRRYGSTVASFLSDHVITQSAPHLAAVARVEWAMVEVLDLADAPVADLEQLKAHPLPDWPRLELHTSNTVRLFESPWNFNGIWKVFRTGGPPAQAPLNQTDGADLVWRHEHQVFHRRCDPNEAAALQLLLEGTTFESLCATMAARGVGPEAVVDLLRRWVPDGLLATVFSPPRQGLR